MSAKVFPCSNIHYSFLEDVDSIVNNAVTLKPGVEWQKISTPNAQISESESIDKAGRSVLQRLRFPALMDNVTLNSIRRRRLIMRVNLSSGREFVFGSLDLPVRPQSFNASEGENQLSFERLTFDFEIYS